MMNIFSVALGSALGGLSRYYVGIWVTNLSGARTLAIVLINVVGSFAIGLFLTLSSDRGWNNTLVLFVAVGFLGGFTTFSTFAWQTLQLAQGDELDRALFNIGASVVIGLTAVWVGAALPKML